MGIEQKVITTITDDHDGEELDPGAEPTIIAIDDIKYTAYLSDFNRARLQAFISDFLSGGPDEDKSDDCRMGDVVELPKRDGRSTYTVETHGFTPAEARAFCKRNGIEVGDRGRLPQSAYDGLKASEDQGCETAEEVRARLAAEFAEKPEPALSTKRVRRTRKPGSYGSDTPKTYARTREENADIDSMAAQLMTMLDAGGDFEVVAEGEPNDRMAQAINNSVGNFTGMRGFEAVSRTAEPRVNGPYGKPLVNILARRLPA